MDLREIVVCFVFLCFSLSEAIKCKCTKESETVQCNDGVCEMDGGSCLMLDHPSSGVHYTCHTKGLRDGSCREKTSKAGAVVKICGCDSSDFCNFAYWPDKSPRSASQPQRQKDVADDDAETSGGFSLLNPGVFTLLSSICVYALHFAQ